MKCNRKKLYEALVALGKIACKGSGDVPILRTVRLEASGGRLKMRTTDLGRYLSTRIDSEGEILCCVPVDQLAKAVKPGPKEDCEIELKISVKPVGGPGKLSIIADGLNITLPAFEVDDYP